MQPAAFSLENYQFDKVNIDLENHKSKELNLSFDTKGIFNKKTKKFELIFKAAIKQSENDSPFVEIRCKGAL